MRYTCVCFLLPLCCDFIDRDRDLDHGSLSGHFVDSSLLVRCPLPVGVDQAGGVDRAGDRVQRWECRHNYHVFAFDLFLVDRSAVPCAVCLSLDIGERAACETSAAVCTSLTREKKTIAPPKLFDLTSLQREANRIYGYTAKQTLDLAQTLYEKKLLTYPRTDSTFLTDDMGETAAGIIALLCGKLPFMAGVSFTPELAKVLNSKKVSDHHAIIPTIELAKADLSALPESERNILTLTGARLLMATAEPHVYEAVTAVFSCADHDFTAKGKMVIAAGWKELERLYRATLKRKPDSDDEESELALNVPDFSEGQTFDKPAVKVTEHDTTPPKPHNDVIFCERKEWIGIEERSSA